MRQVATRLDSAGLGLPLTTRELVRNVNLQPIPDPPNWDPDLNKIPPLGASHVPGVWEGRLWGWYERPVGRHLASSVKTAAVGGAVPTPSLSGDHHRPTKPDTELLIKSVLSPGAGGRRGKVWTGKWWDLPDISEVCVHTGTEYFISVLARMFWLLTIPVFGMKSSMEMTFKKKPTGLFHIQTHLSTLVGKNKKKKQHTSKSCFHNSWVIKPVFLYQPTFPPVVPQPRISTNEWRCSEGEEGHGGKPSKGSKPMWLLTRHPSSTWPPVWEDPSEVQMGIWDPGQVSHLPMVSHLRGRWAVS